MNENKLSIFQILWDSIPRVQKSAIISLFNLATWSILAFGGAEILERTIEQEIIEFPIIATFFMLFRILAAMALIGVFFADLFYSIRFQLRTLQKQDSLSDISTKLEANKQMNEEKIRSLVREEIADIRLSQKGNLDNNDNYKGNRQSE